MEIIHKPLLHAPELDGGLAWFNTRRPLTMKELRGCVVLLDFWTYCCINCMHVLPVLRAVEERFARDPVVVIGVHSGKFSAEQDPSRIREAIGRYDVVHPVVVDDRMAIWSRFAVRSWPTLIVVRPDGTIAAIAPGEPDLETVSAFVQRELDQARAKGTLAASVPSDLAPMTDEHEPLRYPGKVIALPDRRLVVSDSGHHRLLVTSPDGRVDRVVGSGLRGLADGSFDEAAFDDPQGVAFLDGLLYVADARNHTLRAVDLDRGRVTTVAGTGDLGLHQITGRVPGREAPLRSPWDVLAVGDTLYVAMAGSHQIWRYFPADGTIEVYAGTGVEALIDGPVARSAWAQPSGMSVRAAPSGGDRIYVADSETSAIRVIDLARGEVSTLIGEGLFDFGDEEGTAEQAMLQHPLDVAASPDGSLLVADTYNGKIKRIEGEGENSRVRTILSGLHEPGAVSVDSDGSCLVADTNSHRLLRLQGGEARPIEITGAPRSRAGSLVKRRPSKVPEPVDGWFTSLLDLPPGQGLSPGGAVIHLALRTPPGTALAEGAPLSVLAEVSRRSDLLFLKQSVFSIDPARGPAKGEGVDPASSGRTIEVPVEVTALPADLVEAEMVVRVDYLACRTDESSCFSRNVRVRVPVRLLAAGGREALSFTVDLPEIGA